MWYQQMAWKPKFVYKVIQRSLHTKCNADSSCLPLYIYHLSLLYYKCYSTKMSIDIEVISVIIDTRELSRYQFRKFTIYCGWLLKQRNLYIFSPLYLSSLAISLLFYNTFSSLVSIILILRGDTTIFKVKILGYVSLCYPYG